MACAQEHALRAPASAVSRRCGAEGNGVVVDRPLRDKNPNLSDKRALSAPSRSRELGFLLSPTCVFSGREGVPVAAAGRDGEGRPRRPVRTEQATIAPRLFGHHTTYRYKSEGSI